MGMGQQGSQAATGQQAVPGGMPSGNYRVMAKFQEAMAALHQAQQLLHQNQVLFQVLETLDQHLFQA
jgi:hypothetical protein